MKELRTICDSCRKPFNGHVDNQRLRFKVESGFHEFLYGGWIWKKLDLCRECFSGLKIVWEDKCRQIEMKTKGR